MSNKSSSNIFTRAYNLARSAGLFEIPLFKRFFLFSYFLYKRWYEDPFWALGKRSPELFGNGDILDVGANIGYTACVFVETIKPPGKVYAFEPDTASFATLGEVIRRKNLGDAVEIFNMAVGSADGFAVLRDPIACKPAVMAETDEWVAMASEYRAIAVLPGAEDAVSWEPDPGQVYSWGTTLVA